MAGCHHHRLQVAVPVAFVPKWRRSLLGGRHDTCITQLSIYIGIPKDEERMCKNGAAGSSLAISPSAGGMDLGHMGGDHGESLYPFPNLMKLRLALQFLHSLQVLHVKAQGLRVHSIEIRQSRVGDHHRSLGRKNSHNCQKLHAKNLSRSTVCYK